MRGPAESKTWLNVAALAVHKNLARDMATKVETTSDAPELYWAQIPIHNPDTYEDNNLVWLPFVLIHEGMLWLLNKGNLRLEQLCKFPRGSGTDETHKKACRDLKLNPDQTAVAGIHMDGVPMQTI